MTPAERVKRILDKAVGSGTVSYWVKNNPSKARYISHNEYMEAINGK